MSEIQEIKKICNLCHALLPLKKFYKTPKSKDGYTTRCSKCLTQRVINKNNEDKTVTHEQRDAFNKF
jgi:hypothetical protein